MNADDVEIYARDPMTEIKESILTEPPSYVDVAREIGELLVKKNKAYGDSFRDSGKIMSILYPNGIPVDKMVDALCVVRILDKLFRIATDKGAFDESPYRDIGGYAILGAINHEKSDTKVPETSPGS